jgi:hypothetical protein
MHRDVMDQQKSGISSPAAGEKWVETYCAPVRCTVALVRYEAFQLLSWEEVDANGTPP